MNAAMTLIELLVAMAIVGMIFAVAASSLRSVFDVNLKSTASGLASTLRYLSNKAVTDHLYLRVVYDLEQGSYRVEESRDPFTISPEEEREQPEKKPEEEAEGEAAAAVESPFAPSESRLLKPVKLPSGVLFKDIFVSYLPEKREKGTAMTYFFPDGFATATVVNLKDEEDEDHYSVELLPLSGRVKVEGEYREGLTEGKK